MTDARRGATLTTDASSVPRVDPAQLDPTRIDPSMVSLRRHAARGTIVNSCFQIGLYSLGTIERLAVAAWLTPSQYGFWGILLAALMALMWIKSAGISDKYVQQSEADQELAFQKAFTIEMCLSLAFFVMAALALPLYALAYGRPQMIVPGLVLALSVPLTAFEAPAWIPYRRMQYARQRFLSSVDPVVTSLASVALVAAGLGYWGLVVGAVGGSLVGGLTCVATSPYRLRLRTDRQTIRDYVSFSWPLLAFSLCGFVILQGSLLVANRAVGLAGIGAIGMAANIAGLADGVDSIVSQTIYPAICAVARRKELLFEAFVKSNRIALMWAIPVTVGIALFSPDLVHFVLGDRWRPAIGLFTAVTLSCGFGQVAFNWAIFLRAVNNTRPIFRARLVQVIVFLVVSVPAILALGLTGYAIGFAAMTLSQVVMGSYYMRRLFGAFNPFKQLVRGVLPTIPPVAILLFMRGVLGGDRSPTRVLIELVLYGLTSVASTIVLERRLVRELADYLRRSGRRPAAPAVAAGTSPQPTGV
jgi:O-antigen/teichoic acid export membrane protein